MTGNEEDRVDENEPRPVGDVLADKARGLAERHGGGGVLPPDDGEDRDEIAAARRDGLEAARRIRWDRLVPAKFQASTLADFEGRPFYDDLVEWARRPAGRNLVLLGPVGSGKSHAAVAACREAHGRGLDLRYHLVAEALDLLRPGGEDDALDVLSEADRLILDDLGSERPTDWTAERLGILIDRRWREERPTVWTTNLLPDGGDSRNEILRVLGPRSYSRVVGDGALVIRLSGRDRRRNP